MYLPEEEVNNENVTLHIEIKKESMTKLSNDNYDGVNLDGLMLDEYLMPGFQVRWWYTGEEILPERKYKDQLMTKHFIRFELTN